MLRNDDVDEPSLFQLFFLRDDANQSVEVAEVEKIDFRDIKERLVGGESVFIKCIPKQPVGTNFPERERGKNPGISHMNKIGGGELLAEGHKCGACGMTFPTKGALDEHKKTHM